MVFKDIFEPEHVFQTQRSEMSDPLRNLIIQMTRDNSDSRLTLEKSIQTLSKISDDYMKTEKASS